MNRSSAARLLLRLTILIVVVVVGTEVGLRWVGLATHSPSGYPVGMYVGDADVTFKLAADFMGPMDLPEGPVVIQTNSHGFRDDPFEPKTAGTFRILALGDSFGFGHGVEVDEAYPEILEGLLVEPGRSVEVFNLGVPGYNTRQELAQLRQIGASLEPDLVLLGCYLGNDLSGNLERREALPRPRHGVLVAADLGEAEWRVTLRADLNQYSRAYRTYQSWRRNRDLRLLAEVEDGIKGAACELLDWSAGFAMEMLLAEPTPDAIEATRLTLEALDAMHVYCTDTLGVPFVNVLIPSPVQYHPAGLEAIGKECGIDIAIYDLDRPNRDLLAAGAAAGYTVLDLTPALRDRTRQDPATLLFSDVHLNEIGHLLAAAEMTRHLREQGLLR